MSPTLLSDFMILVKRYKSRFIKGFFLVALSNILFILNPFLLKNAINQLSNEPDHFILWKWVLALVLVAALASYLKYWMRLEFISISRDAERHMREKLFVKIQSQSMHFYNQHGVGELVSRLSNDISMYRDVLGPGVMYPLFFITLVFPGVIALFTLSPILALVSLLPLVAIPLVNWGFRASLYSLSKKIQETMAEMSGFAQESYSGVRIVKAYSIESFLKEKFLSICKSLARFNFRMSMLVSIENPMFTFLMRGTTIILTLVASRLVLSPNHTLNAADFISFMWIQSYISLPILMLAWIMPMYQKGRAAYDRLRDLYNEPIEVGIGGAIGLKIPKAPSIELSHLSFIYPGRKEPALKDLNLVINPGEFIGITGAVGSGKSTLFHLLSRSYEVKADMIKINGREIHDYTQEACHEAIVVVEQTPFLFSKSIAENVRFGNEAATLEEIEAVAKMADLHTAVLDFPDQYDTLVGERGVTLSGGQKQRLAIARALLVNRSIILLDEIFSAVDAETEGRIFKSLQGHFKGKTVLMITSRSSILEQADRIVVFEAGKIIEEGRPQDLKKQKSRYAALYELQNL